MTQSFNFSDVPEWNNGSGQTGTNSIDRKNLFISDIQPNKWRLQIERVPRPMWGINLRSIIPDRWNEIARLCYRAEGYRCSICYGSGLESGRKHPVEAHEVWAYDDLTHVQSLIGIQALCPACHRCKHPGMSEAEGYDHTVHIHLMKVNGCTRKEAIEYCQESLSVAKHRSRFPWTLDISKLEEILQELEQKTGRNYAPPESR